MSKHPVQPIETVDGVKRFKENAIVQFLLNAGPFGMNHLASMTFSQEDREQFAQLIGYSVSGFGDLSYVSDETYQRATAQEEDNSQPQTELTGEELVRLAAEKVDEANSELQDAISMMYHEQRLKEEK